MLKCLKDVCVNSSKETKVSMKEVKRQQKWKIVVVFTSTVALKVFTIYFFVFFWSFKQIAQIAVVFFNFIKIVLKIAYKFIANIISKLYILFRVLSSLKHLYIKQAKCVGLER